MDESTDGRWTKEIFPNPTQPNPTQPNPTKPGFSSPPKRDKQKIQPSAQDQSSSKSMKPAEDSEPTSFSWNDTTMKDGMKEIRIGLVRNLAGSGKLRLY